MRGTQSVVCVLALAACFQARGWAQTPSTSTAGGQQAAATQTANDAWLTHVRSLYTSTERDGLNGFTCAAQIDWRTMMASANKGTVDAAGERKIAALSGAHAQLEAHLDGSSNVDIDVPTPPADLADSVQTIVGGTKQSIGGFVQFWSPFANESVIPENSAGVDVSTTAGGGHILHVSDSGTSVTETFDANDVLREYDVQMTGTTALVTPTFTPSAKGLQVTAFLAHYQAQGNAGQDIQVKIGYSDVNGFSIPSDVNMSVVGTATINFTLSGCKVNP